MILINRNEKPCDTVYYISACILKKIKDKNKIKDLEGFYNEIMSDYKLQISHDNFIYALNFLYLLNKIKFNDEEEIVYVN